MTRWPQQVPQGSHTNSVTGQLFAGPSIACLHDEDVAIGTFGIWSADFHGRAATFGMKSFALGSKAVPLSVLSAQRNASEGGGTAPPIGPEQSR